MATTNPHRPTPIRLRSLQVGQWVQRKNSPLDVLQIRQVWRHDKRVQLVRDMGDQPPFSVPYHELARDYRSIGQAP
jgi:hypothetical protein